MTVAASRRKRHALIFLFFVLLLTGSLAGAYWWAKARDAKPADAKPRAARAGDRPAPVTVQAVERTDLQDIIAAIGTANAFNTAIVRPRVDGVLQEIRFQEGQLIKAGDVLARLDPAIFEATLRNAQGALERDAALLKNAELDLLRFEDLWKKDSISRQQVDTQQALVQQLRGTAESDRAMVEQARLNLSYTQIKAPISGRLGLRQVDIGNLVRSGDATGLVTITQNQPITVVFAVPDVHVAKISATLRAGKPLLLEAWDKSFQTRLGKGKVISTDNAIDPATGTLRIKAVFPNTDETLFPNQFVNVRLGLDVQKGVLAVPVGAVQRGSVGTFVYVVQDDQTVSLRKVSTGLADGARVAITGDIEAGMRVVTEGADRLRDGGKAEVIEPGAALGDADTRSGGKGRRGSKPEGATGSKP
jgi:multidrug efflux system membrane fusion protein